MSKLIGKLVGLALVAAVGLASSHDAFAQSRPRTAPSHIASAPAREAPVSGKVSVEMMVIYAHNEDNRVDPRLRSVMQHLRNFRFSGYKVLDTHPAQLAVGQDTSFSLPGGRKVRLDLLSRDDKQARVRIRMLNGNEKVLDTTVSIHRNRSFMIGGPGYEKGKLILPLTVKY